MYKSLKKIAKRIIPEETLRKNESFFRKLISLKYKGNNHKCNICEINLSRFVELEDKDLLCPNCGSRSRTRRLYEHLNNSKTLTGNILHFSPPKSLYNKFKATQNNYFSSDFENEFLADYAYDITAISSKDNFFNSIICYHILEHIEDDIKAMSELYRVLKPDSYCYIQTPYKDGDIYEDYSIISPKEREKAFGQKDHVRIYSIEGLKGRLESVGFKTKIVHHKEDLYFGFKEEIMIIAKK
jgi:SAM-dependent methyltransferase